MIIVLDTNVIVSGIFGPLSKAASILRPVAGGAILLIFAFSQSIGKSWVGQSLALPKKTGKHSYSRLKEKVSSFLASL